jgi:hypothetical protein
VVIYLKHPTHGNKVAISEDEAKADEKLGWIRYVVGQPVVESGAGTEESESGGQSGGEPASQAVDTREYLAEQYKQRFGKAPHHKKSAETLKAELAKEVA